MMMVKNQLRVMIKGKKWKKILGRLMKHHHHKQEAVDEEVVAEEEGVQGDVDHQVEMRKEVTRMMILVTHRIDATKLICCSIWTEQGCFIVDNQCCD
jgi:hypothetical protein